MRIALISCNSIRYMPYLSLYSELIEKTGNSYIIITEHELNMVNNPLHFVYNGKCGGGILNKIENYLKWRSFVIKTLKEQKVERIVFFTNWPPIKLLDQCITRWRNKYIFDLRDFSIESKRWARIVEKMIIRNSIATVISSKGFLTWLPPIKEYKIAHNMPTRYVIHSKCKSFQKEVVTIGYVGMLNYFQQNKRIVDATNGTKYRLVYAGSAVKSCTLEQYCVDKNYRHVTFSGAFENSEKEKLYDGIDLINAVYGNETEIVRHAIPNKLYDCLIYKIPILANKGTYLGELVVKSGVGIAIDTMDGDFVNCIDSYIRGFNRNCFEKSCEGLLRTFRNEQDMCKKSIIKALDLLN